ncbi:MAG: DUF3768 domain-containing protein [Azospirillum sp.]|nr:DUF3768 domain-containing protein [Azospirillum sp.]
MSNISEIAIQNDNFRKHLSQGTLVLTQGIRSNTPEDIKEIITKVRNFDTFDENNDPYNEHDFGAFDYKGKRIFWKIDNYDREFLYLSPDVSNPRLTNKVMTIMYAEEY